MMSADRGRFSWDELPYTRYRCSECGYEKAICHAEGSPMPAVMHCFSCRAFAFSSKYAPPDEIAKATKEHFEAQVLRQRARDMQGRGAP